MGSKQLYKSDLQISILKEIAGFLIQVVQEKIQTSWEIQVLVQDIISFFTRFNNDSINHIFRQGNSAVDWLAKFVLSVYSTNVWNAISHRDLCFILVEDNLGRTLEKMAS